MLNFVIISGKRSAEAEPWWGWGGVVLAPVVHAVGEDGKLVGTTNIKSFFSKGNVVISKEFVKNDFI